MTTYSEILEEAVSLVREIKDELFTLRERIKRLEADHNRLKDLLEDVATSGVEDVKGLRYLTVQIYRDVWEKIQAELAEARKGKA